MPITALVGCAHIHTPGFVQTLQQHPAMQVKYVWDHQADRAARWARELGAQVTHDLTDIWRDTAVESVIIASETNRHETLVLPATAARKHLFVEKPLGTGAADAERMAAAIEAAGVYFHTGYFMRGQPAHQFIRAQLQAGTLGKITRIRHSNCHSGSLGGWFDGEWRWMADVAQAGVGAFGDLGAHSLDILIWLMGDVEQATATIDIATARYGDCDEYGEGLLKFASGAVGTLAAGWVDVANPVTCIVSGTEGHIHIVDEQVYFHSQHIAGADGKSVWHDLPAPADTGFPLFLDVLTGQAAHPLVTAREAAARNAVMQAMYEGNRQRRWLQPAASA
jgi:predicted dehydrogenase